MKKIALFAIVLIFTLSGCQVLEQILKQAMQTTVAPTDTEIVQGLKQALQIGTGSAVTSLNKKDGFYGNQKVKIPMPPEVQSVLNVALNNTVVKSTGMDKLLQEKIDKFLLSVNRSAEAAVVEAKPIFINAITNLTITQGLNILQGKDLSGKVSGFDSVAASHYLELKTRSSLFSLFQPKLNSSLSKDLGLGFSANQAWDNLTGYYNSYVASIIGKPKITYSLSEFTTNKALDGLFYMMGNEEKKIRKDPYQYAYDIIKKVFGYVKK